MPYSVVRGFRSGVENRRVPAGSGAALPPDAVAGGSEDDQPLLVCRSAYAGGVYPGKVVNGQCSISYAGKEIPVPAYQVMYAEP